MAYPFLLAAFNALDVDLPSAHVLSKSIVEIKCLMTRIKYGWMDLFLVPLVGVLLYFYDTVNNLAIKEWHQK